MADATGLQPEFASEILAMIAASNGKLWINSGYRSDARQAELYAAAVQKYGAAEAGNWVAPPGHSNHNRGLAVDLGGDLALAKALAPRFGLTFPMSWEPWHIEPMGLRGKHGVNDPQAYTNPPAGSGASVVHEDPYGSLHNQITIFTQLLQGRTPQEIDAQFSGATAGEAGGGAPGQEPLGGITDTSGGTVTPESLYTMLRNAGLDPVHAAAGVAIAGRESNYNASAHNNNPSTGDNSYGLFQVNLLGGMHSQFSPSDLLTVGGSVNAFAAMVNGSEGLRPWGGYKGKSWAYDTNLPAAVQASGGEVSIQDLEALAGFAQTPNARVS